MFQTIESGLVSLPIAGDFSFNVSSTSTLLLSAKRRYESLFALHPASAQPLQVHLAFTSHVYFLCDDSLLKFSRNFTPNCHQVNMCYVRVADETIPLMLGVSEEYSLVVSADGECTISSETVIFH